MGRRELLRWVNRTVGVEYVQVESCADGVALAQLVDAAYPDARVPLYRLDFATRHEHDRARNLEVVRATLDRLDLDVPLDVKEMSRGAYRACDEALRWLYLVVQRERPRSATRGYDGRARRLEALEKRRYLARAPSKSPGWRSAASWDDGSGGDSSRAATAEDPDGDAPFSFSFRPRLSMDDGVAYSDEGSDGGRGLEMSVDSLDGPGEEDDQKTSSRAAARKETSRRENRNPLASVSVGNGKHKATTGAGAGASPAVVRPATAPFARRRSTVSVVASARVDISPEPEPEPDPRRSPLSPEAEAEPSSGDENRSYRSSRPRTPFVGPRSSSLSPRPSSARLYTPRRSLDKWAEKARLKLESLESRERSSPRDSEPRGRERRRAYEDASSSSSSSSSSDEPDAFSKTFSRFTNWTASPPGSAERAARLRREARAQALARTPRGSDAVQTAGRFVEEKESTTRARLARAEVAEIKAREAARRRRKEAERRARLEAEAEAEARAAEERRLELEAEEAARYAREVASARREVRLEEARARRARRRREVREALRLEEPISDEAPDATDSGRVPFSFSAAFTTADAAAPSPSGAAAAPAALARKRADLASLAEYLKWELAAELKRFEAAKRDTAAVVRERDDAILRLGIAETRRRLAAREPSAS